LQQLSSDHSVEKRRVCDFWVAHCIIKEVNYVKEKKAIEVKMVMHQAASNIPEGLTDGNSHRSALELIHRTLPQRYVVTFYIHQEYKNMKWISHRQYTV